MTLSDLISECIGYGWQGIVEGSVKQFDEEEALNELKEDRNEKV
jgi:hypothetical protein